MARGRGSSSSSAKGTEQGCSATRKSRSKKRELETSGSSEPPKRGRRKMNQTGSASRRERRLSRFVSEPNAAVSERIQRAFQHRLYLIQRKLLGHPNKPSSCEFVVLGATGNVYTVRLDRRPSCTCPDFLRGNTCKHILFVMLRVLKLPRDDPRVWQKALLSSELDDLLHTTSINEAVLASQLVRDRFREIAGSSHGQGGEDKVRQRDLGGDCPVCYEVMEKGLGKEAVVFCKACGNNVHGDCFMKWSKSKGSGMVTCIYCRAPWESDSKNRKNKKKVEDYVNLAEYSSSHQPEETSLETLYPETYFWISRRGS